MSRHQRHTYACLLAVPPLGNRGSPPKTHFALSLQRDRGMTLGAYPGILVCSSWLVCYHVLCVCVPRLTHADMLCGVLSSLWNTLRPVMPGGHSWLPAAVYRRHSLSTKSKCSSSLYGLQSRQASEGSNETSKSSFVGVYLFLIYGFLFLNNFVVFAKTMCVSCEGVVLW